MRRTVKGMVPIQSRDIVLTEEQQSCLNAYNALFQQRAERQNDAYRVGRAESQVSPYDESNNQNSLYTRAYTQDELNMRRKIEILKYNKNSMESKTNTLSYETGRAWNLSTKRKSCPQDDLLPSSTADCNIPGPIQTIQYDPTIPLYNYKGVLNTSDKSTTSAFL